MTRRRIAGLIGLFALLWGSTHAHAQSAIRLRTLATVAPGAPVTLADIAVLSGPEAERFSGLTILPAMDGKSGSARIDISRVRKEVQRQPRVNMGRLSMTGSSCIVRTVAAPAPSPTTPQAAAVPAQGETVRDRIARSLVQLFGVPESDMRLTFDTRSGLLDETTEGRTVGVQPSSMGEQITYSIRIYKDDAMLSQGSVRVGVLIRRNVVIARQTLPRGSAISLEAFETQEQWLSPTLEPATPDQVADAVVRTRIDANKIILAKDIEAPVVVQRGDVVSVDCVSGTVVISTSARAKDAGRTGDVITFQNLNSRKTFSARISGPGRAVLLAEDAGSEP